MEFIANTSRAYPRGQRSTLDGGEAVASSAVQPHSTDAGSDSVTLAEAFKRDWAFFVQHKAELLRNLRGKYIAIRDGEIIAIATTDRELAENEFVRNHRCLIKRIVESEFDVQDEHTVIHT